MHRLHRLHRFMRAPALLGLAAWSLLLGCSGATASPDGSGGASGGSGGGGSGGNAAPLTYKPCDVDKRVGGFAMALAPATKNAPAFSTFQGGMNNAPTPSNNWPEMAKEGDCHLVVGPKLVCTTPCSNDQVCAGQNQCLPQPVPQNLGDIALTGFSMPIVAKFMGNQYYAPLPMPFPPFAAEVALGMTTAGGPYPPFTLNGRGVEPMEFAATNLMVMRDKPLAVTWTAPKKPTSARVFVRMDIAHHGGVAARIECDVADSGSMTIAGSLISKLIDQGTAGFPTVSVTRRTMDSTTIAPGCVELSVASPVEQSISVDGVISCNEEMPCPAGKTCGADLKCS